MGDNPSPLEILQFIRDKSGVMGCRTNGLSDDVIDKFSKLDPKLRQAIEEAKVIFSRLIDEFGLEILQMEETSLISHLQTAYVNFYSPATINPYVAISACGPWIITSKGAVIHDNGGYGMLGFGHAPSAAVNAMSENWVMANVMTPSFSQLRLVERLESELGHTRGHCPFTNFILWSESYLFTHLYVSAEKLKTF